MAQFKRFNSSENPTRSDTTAAYPNGTLTWDDTNGLRLHDGSTLGGNAIGSGGGGDHMTVRNSTLQLDGAGVAWTGSYGAGDYNYGGFYSADTNNTLFTFSSNGTPSMSVQLDGALFVGSSAPPNSAGVNITNPGWIVATGGAKFGGDINTAGAMGITGGITWSTSGSQIFEDSSLVMYSPSADVVLTAGEAALSLLPNGVLQVPPILQGGGGDPNVYIQVQANGGWETWTFDNNGALTIPGYLNLPGNANIVASTNLSIYSNSNSTVDIGSANANVVVYGGNVEILTNNQNGQAKAWTWYPNGNLTFPDGGSLRVANPPTHSTGTPGDKAGMIAFDNTAIYYCTQDYFSISLTVNNIRGPSQGATYSNNGGGFGIMVGFDGPISGLASGQTFTYNGVLRTIQDVTNTSDQYANIIFTPYVDTSDLASFTAGTQLSISAGSPSNIWVKTPWAITSW
jgi:hypothetical protein